ISAACEQWQRTELCDSAALVVTELVANGVRHAGTPLIMRLMPIAQGIRLEIADDSSREVRARDAKLLDEGGRGLFLVDALAERWGVDAHPAGKRVWAEIVA
ncbi:MAG: ATP-binding protein, partial [Actinomycetota bacterium]|nr:ATP-binding protein [Actinomycetota bacterium]